MKRIVIKIGTGSLNRQNAIIVAEQIAKLTSKGIEVILVSSGAIKSGKDRMKRLGQKPELAKKEWAGIGARHLLNLWGNAFKKYGLEVAQIWLTYANWSHESEHESVKTSILSYCASGCVIPLINENDVVSDREIVLMEKGISENDRLARMVAEMVSADGVLFLTQSGGVYDGDPDASTGAKKYHTVGRDVSKTLRTYNRSSHGTGGISRKLEEAFICFEKGMRVSIAGVSNRVIIDFAQGKSVGTMIDTISS